MKTFSELGIKDEKQRFTGAKIDVFDIFNQEIIVYAYKVEKSKFDKEYDKCLHLQFSLNGTMHVSFIGSRNLVETIEQIRPEDFPFKTTIRKKDKRYVFT